MNTKKQKHTAGSMELKCGCHAYIFHQTQEHVRFGWEWCNLHKYAPDLLEAAIAILEDHGTNTGNMDLLRAAVSKAKSHE